eukprot:CAMPEP_0182425012 /NCGR_PEP_ID=MMETSP1167-20130531/11344_1 /TAXON_ID=2988 /ORGANISM="Mallomonas Sp, Strain CCMP3275" /LENGTH=81 /DNA_ID=CAMNT_0024605311 /DNA_START=92 /DNA_END=333 /DNA_ORIENTATION=+
MSPSLSVSLFHSKVWSARHLLEHLYVDKSGWGVTTVMQTMNDAIGRQTQTSISRIEKEVRQGDRYDISPKQWNILREVWLG